MLAVLCVEEAFAIRMRDSGVMEIGLDPVLLGYRVFTQLWIALYAALERLPASLVRMKQGIELVRS